MRVRQITAIVVWIALATPVLAEPPDAQEILKQAQAAAKASQAISYDGEFISEGSIAKLLPSQLGRVTLVRTAAALPKLRADTWSLADDGSALLGAEMVSDGNAVGLIDHRRKQFTQQTGPGASSLLAQWGGLILFQLVGHQPYYQELQSDAVVYEGTREVDGVECDVVRVPLSGGKVEYLWCFGKADALPRRMERTLSAEVGGGKVTLLLHAPNVNPEINEEMFRFDPPPEYTSRLARALDRSVQPSPQSGPTFLATGTEAPDWSLKAPDGQTVTLKELRGKIVVLDFWATWCRPCILAMPGLQELHNDYKDKPVAIYGVNTFEHGDPVRFMKRAGYTYEILLKGDRTARAYKVVGIPTFYVIGPEGQVVYAASGTARQAKLKVVIDGLLRSMETPKAQEAPTDKEG